MNYLIKCTNGNSWVTSFNGDHLAAVEYYAGQVFTRECQVTGKETRDCVHAVFKVEDRKCPVWRVQCFTSRVQDIYMLEDTQNTVTAGDHYLMHFRVKPEYRTAYSYTLRNKLAQTLRKLRSAK